MNANLVSISALDNAGLTVTFGQGKGEARKPDRTIVLAGKNMNGMYLLDPVDSLPNMTLAMKSQSQSISLEQWHRQFTHCSPLTIAKQNLADSLQISGVELTGRCEDCILGQQTHRLFDGTIEKALPPLDLISFDLWGPSCVQLIGGKIFLIIIIDAGTAYKYGAYLADKSNITTIGAFNVFRARAETLTGWKIHRLRTDGAFNSSAWTEYLQKYGISHEPMAPYSSAQNGLAE